MEFQHYSVLLQETIEQLNIQPDGVYVDGTLGGGGHAEQICLRLSDRGHLYGFDQDGDAVEAALRRLKAYENRVTVIRSNFRFMRERLAEEGICKVNGILLDLGVSSFQLDTVERGFSYREDAPLDMRMDDRQSLTARDIVNTYPEKELYRISLL
ncbi:MAG: 16S rRNA (cytosine(1402)-N(4))-methyltransferase RsmH, partial [Lachnospiraceae bacterium]|nr:16S rRNA (cytosine(1402)-N(4))-methyltransferase RsmH [Lachnospiraceae bacterium]